MICGQCLRRGILSRCERIPQCFWWVCPWCGEVECTAEALHRACGTMNGKPAT